MKSEQWWIDWLGKLPQDLPKALALGIGDDAAVVNFPPGHQLTVSHDLLVQDAHFRLDRVSPSLLGRKALRVNLSDLAAMGSDPLACLLGVALPADSDGSYLEKLVEGLLVEARHWTCPLIGGDLSKGSSIAISVTVLGSVPIGKALLRSRASAGDSIVVIGPLGLSRLGFETLDQLPSHEALSLDSPEAIKKRVPTPFKQKSLLAHLLPQPQLQPAIWLRDHALASAAIDISDGLAIDLFRIARASGLQAVIDARRLPLPESDADEKMQRSCALDGGEDYALLFTASAGQLTRIEEHYPRSWQPYHVIGVMSRGSPSVWLKDEQGLKLYEPMGFDHFQ